MAASNKKNSSAKQRKKRAPKSASSPKKKQPAPVKRTNRKKPVPSKKAAKAPAKPLTEKKAAQPIEEISLPQVRSTEEFVQHYGKPVYDFKSNQLFVRILATTVTFIVIFFAIQSQLHEFDPTKVVLSDEYKRKFYTEVYANIPPEIKKKQVSSPEPRTITRQNRNAPRQRPKLAEEAEARLRVIAVEIQADDIEALLEPLENTLLSIDQLDSILGGFAEAYSAEMKRELIKKYVGAFHVETADDIAINTRKLEKAKSDIEFIKTSSAVKRRSRGYRNRDDIIGINIAINNEEDQIMRCYTKFRRIHFDLEGFIKVEFYINPQGRVIRESVKVAETNIEYADFIECVLKKVKAFRKIPSASKDAKGDYLFEKKWVFNY